MTEGARILGTHVKFFREGDDFTIPSAGTASRIRIPGDDDAGWIDLGAIADSSAELAREDKEVWAPQLGQFKLHDIISTKRGFVRGFTVQELSPFVIEMIYGAGSLDELSEDFEALSGVTKKGWLLAHRYDQNDQLVAREKAYVHLAVDGEVALGPELVTVRFKATQLIDRTGQALLTQSGFFLLTQSGHPILTQQ